MYCLNCGFLINNKERYCTSCGAPIQGYTTIESILVAEPMAFQKDFNQSGLKKKRLPSLMILVALLLILMGIGYLGLTVTGVTVTAQVVDYEQVLILNNDSSTRNPSRYQLVYQFIANGEQYDGTITRVFPNGSHLKNTIKIRYLPLWPHVNTEDGNEMVLAGPTTTGLGILILLFALKKRRNH